MSRQLLGLCTESSARALGLPPGSPVAAAARHGFNRLSQQQHAVTHRPCSPAAATVHAGLTHGQQRRGYKATISFTFEQDEGGSSSSGVSGRTGVVEPVTDTRSRLTSSRTASHRTSSAATCSHGQASSHAGVSGRDQGAAAHTAAAGISAAASSTGEGMSAGGAPTASVLEDIARSTPGSSLYHTFKYDVLSDTPYPIWLLDPQGSVYPFVLSVAQRSAAALEYLHDAANLPWWAAIIAAGALARVAILPFTVYSLRNASRAVDARNDLISLRRAYQRAAAALGPSATASERAKLLLVMQRGVHAALRRVNCHPLRSLAMPLLQVPVVIAGVLGARHAVLLGDSRFETEGALWFTDLTTPDPTYVLPMVSLSLAYASLEVMFGSKKTVAAGGASLLGGNLADKVKNMLQMTIMASAPFLTELPAGLYLLMTANSVWTIGYLSAVRNPAIHAALTGREIPTATSSGTLLPTEDADDGGHAQPAGRGDASNAVGSADSGSTERQPSPAAAIAHAAGNVHTSVASASPHHVASSVDHAGTTLLEPSHHQNFVYLPQPSAGHHAYWAVVQRNALTASEPAAQARVFLLPAAADATSKQGLKSLHTSAATAASSGQPHLVVAQRSSHDAVQPSHAAEHLAPHIAIHAVSRLAGFARLNFAPARGVHASTAAADPAPSAQRDGEKAGSGIVSSMGGSVSTVKPPVVEEHATAQPFAAQVPRLMRYDDEMLSFSAAEEARLLSALNTMDHRWPLLLGHPNPFMLRIAGGSQSAPWYNVPQVPSNSSAKGAERRVGTAAHGTVRSSSSAVPITTVKRADNGLPRPSPSGIPGTAPRQAADEAHSHVAGASSAGMTNNASAQRHEGASIVSTGAGTKPHSNSSSSVRSAVQADDAEAARQLKTIRETATRLWHGSSAHPSYTTPRNARFATALHTGTIASTIYGVHPLVNRGTTTYGVNGQVVEGITGIDWSIGKPDSTVLARQEQHEEARWLRALGAVTEPEAGMADTPSRGKPGTSVAVVQAAGASGTSDDFAGGGNGSMAGGGGDDGRDGGGRRDVPGSLRRRRRLARSNRARQSRNTQILGDAIYGSQQPSTRKVNARRSGSTTPSSGPAALDESLESSRLLGIDIARQVASIAFGPTSTVAETSTARLSDETRHALVGGNRPDPGRVPHRQSGRRARDAPRRATPAVTSVYELYEEVHSHAAGHRNRPMPVKDQDASKSKQSRGVGSITPPHVADMLNAGFYPAFTNTNSVPEGNNSSTPVTLVDAASAGPVLPPMQAEHAATIVDAEEGDNDLVEHDEYDSTIVLDDANVEQMTLELEAADTNADADDVRFFDESTRVQADGAEVYHVDGHHASTIDRRRKQRDRTTTTDILHIDAGVAEAGSQAMPAAADGDPSEAEPSNVADLLRVDGSGPAVDVAALIRDSGILDNATVGSDHGVIIGHGVKSISQFYPASQRRAAGKPTSEKSTGDAKAGASGAAQSPAGQTDSQTEDASYEELLQVATAYDQAARLGNTESRRNRGRSASQDSNVHRALLHPGAKAALMGGGVVPIARMGAVPSASPFPTDLDSNRDRDVEAETFLQRIAHAVSAKELAQGSARAKQAAGVFDKDDTVPAPVYGSGDAGMPTGTEAAPTSDVRGASADGGTKGGTDGGGDTNGTPA